MNTMSNRLRRIALVANLPQETLSRVANTVIRITYAPVETIILEGAPCQAAYFLAQGHVRALRTSQDGREQVLVQLGAHCPTGSRGTGGRSRPIGCPQVAVAEQLQYNPA